MANKNDFDYLSILHSQIQSIDKMLSTESTMKEKYESISNYFNAIDKSKLDEADLKDIINNMRDCLINAYINKFNEVNRDIKLTE